MCDNLEIFVLTYNRAAMLKESLKSICEQTASGFDIIVLDNASTDNSRAVVEDIQQQYPGRNIEFISLEKNIGGMGNFKRARLMAQKKWAMLFHDDDLIHPEYIKNAMGLLSKHPDAVMASCTFKQYEHPDANNWGNFPGGYYIGDVKYFAALMFGSLLHNFASTIYKSSLLQATEPKNELYGKISDRPYLLEVAKHGKSIVLKDAYIRYRNHPGQDTNTFDTGPFAPEWFAFLNCYKDIMGNSWFDKYGILYNLFVQSKLKMGYYWIKGVNSQMPFKQFKKMAVENKIIRKFEEPKLVEKLCKVCSSIFEKFLYF